jgi:hypothetical protein
MKTFIFLILVSLHVYADPLHVESDIYETVELAFSDLDDKIATQTHIMYSQKWGPMLYTDFIEYYDDYKPFMYKSAILSLKESEEGYMFIINLDVDMDFNPIEFKEYVKENEASEGLIKI